MAAPGGQGVLTFSEAPWLTPTALLSDACGPERFISIHPRGTYPLSPASPGPKAQGPGAIFQSSVRLLAWPGLRS